MGSEISKLTFDHLFIMEIDREEGSFDYGHDLIKTDPLTRIIDNHPAHQVHNFLTDPLLNLTLKTQSNTLLDFPLLLVYLDQLAILGAEEACPDYRLSGFELAEADLVHPDGDHCQDLEEGYAEGPDIAAALLLPDIGLLFVGSGEHGF